MGPELSKMKSAHECQENDKGVEYAPLATPCQKQGDENSWKCCQKKQRDRLCW